MHSKIFFFLFTAIAVSALMASDGLTQQQSSTVEDYGTLVARLNAALGPRSPFGSVAFDPLPSSPNPSQYPPWSSVTCLQDVSSPPEIVGNDPETWTPSVWNLKNNALLEQGGFTTGGLVYFYFLNTLGKTARLYVGARGTGSTSTTFKYGVGKAEAVGSVNYEIGGALATANFLELYVSGIGLSSGTAPGSTATPRPLFAPITVANNVLVTGEVDVTSVSGPTNFYVYADDCSPTACPSITNTAAGDGQMRGGYFTGAHFTINHNYTASISNSSGGISWQDIGRTPTDTCVPALIGKDPIRGNSSRTLKGDYGVPIVIQGTPYKQYEQFWYLNPRGNVPFAAALWVQEMTDPNTLKLVNPAAYYLPTTAPSASPQPTVVPDTSHAITLGLDGSTDTRKLVYVPSGGDSWPVRFYYIIPAGLASLDRAKQQ